MFFIGVHNPEVAYPSDHRPIMDDAEKDRAAAHYTEIARQLALEFDEEQVAVEAFERWIANS